MKLTHLLAPAALARLFPNVAYTLQPSENGLALADWPADVPPPSEAAVAAMIATIEAEQASEHATRKTERTRLVTLATSAVGQPWTP